MKAYSIAVTPHSSEAAVRSTGGGTTRCLRRRGGPPSLAPFRCETVNGGWNARTAAAGHRGAAPAAARAGCRPNAAHARLLLTPAAPAERLGRLEMMPAGRLREGCRRALPARKAQGVQAALIRGRRRATPVQSRRYG